MSYYSVEVTDRVTRMVVVIGQALSKPEAIKLSNAVKAFNACEVDIRKFTWFSKKGKIVE